MNRTFQLEKGVGLFAVAAVITGPLVAQIDVLNTISLVSPVADDPKTAVLSFDAGPTADKLIVQVSAEGQNVDSITYQGTSLSQAAGPNGRNKGIFYLDNPFSGGAADLSITLAEGNSNGIAIGVVSISGAAPGVATTALANPATGVTLTVPVTGSLVVSGYAANGSGSITLPAGHAALYNSTNIGSAHAAASYANAQPAGDRTDAFVDTNPTDPVASAAVFVPASAVPVIMSTSPGADATSVPADANLVATFSEPVVAGSGRIELWKTGETSPLESFDVGSSSRLTFDGPTLTVDPVGNLAPDTVYHVRIASTAVADTTGGQLFSGISDPLVWAFSTGSSPPLAPTFSPKHDAFGVSLNANLVATFSETIQKGNGNITIHQADGTLFESISVGTSAVSVAGGKVTINPANNFIAGRGYYVLIDPTALRNTAGQYYAGIADSTVWNFTALPDLATVDGRLEWSIQQNISDPWPATTGAPGMASYALAAMHLGTEVEAANHFINQFHSQFPVPDSDTIGFDSYFWLHLIWRIYHDPAMNARLTPQARANIEDMMWKWIRTRSRLTDAQGTEWVYHNSENHDAMQKGGLLLCAEALKDAPGYGPNMVLADGRTIGEHATAWSDYFQRYFISRAREGINAEIASPIYAKYTVGVYYNLMDFAESPALRSLAERFITLYWADTASDWSLSGVRGGAETRCYKDNYLRLGTQYSFRAILGCYGWWNTDSSVVRTYGLIPAASAYRVPEIITACATDPARPGFLYTSRRWGRTSGSSGEDNLITFDNGNSNLRRDTWVTPAYSMGTLTFDMNRDYLQIIDQNRAMGVMFASGVNDRVMVFGKGAANGKSYADLSGVTRADCMIVQRDQNANSSGNGTLVFVPNNLWDARVETGGWLFIQSGNAYCALRPAGGTYSAATAANGVDLAMSNIWAPVIIQTGQAANYADFAAFQASVIANALTFSSNTLNYTSEAGDTFTFYANSKTTPRVNGATVSLNPAKTYDSPYLSMMHGESVASISYPGYPDLLLEFATPLLVEALYPAAGTTGVSLDDNLVMVFDKPVRPGSGRIELWQFGGTSPVESFDVASSSWLDFNEETLTISPTGGLELGTNYYVLIDDTAIEDLSGNAFAGLANSSEWSFATPRIATVATGSKIVASSPANSSTTLSFDAGGNADALIVAISSEKENKAYTVTYDGEALAPAIDRNSVSIWYLDITTSSYTGGAADLIVDFSGVGSVNGVGIGAVSITSGGQAIEVHSSAESSTDPASLTLNTSVDESFNVVCFNANGSNGSVLVNAPLVPIFQGSNIGSARGAAGYQNGTAAGSHLYSWSVPSEPRKAVAAAFAVTAVPGNTFVDWISNPAFGLAEADQGFEDDPDGDGIPNGVENFFGTHPGEFSRTLVATSANAGTFTFSHPQGTPASDLSARYRWSTDLVNFHYGGETSGELSVSFSAQADTPVEGMTTVTATIIGPSVDCLFVDIEVTGP